MFHVKHNISRMEPPAGRLSFAGGSATPPKSHRYLKIISRVMAIKQVIVIFAVLTTETQRHRGRKTRESNRFALSKESTNSQTLKKPPCLCVSAIRTQERHKKRLGGTKTQLAGHCFEDMFHVKHNINRMEPSTVWLNFAGGSATALKTH